MEKVKLKKNDPVVVISGKRADHRKVGKVIQVLVDKKRVVIEKIHMIKEYVRPNPQKNIQGGIVEREGTVPISNVMYYCKECEQGVRIGFQVKDEKKVRVCKKCNTPLA